MDVLSRMQSPSRSRDRMKVTFRAARRLAADEIDDPPASVQARSQGRGLFRGPCCPDQARQAFDQLRDCLGIVIVDPDLPLA
jgi:hypothetical protein